MSRSIIQIKKECYITKSTTNLHKHHIFEGTANRKLSEEDGMWIWLRADWHNMSNYGVHFNKELDLLLKRTAQLIWQEYYNKTKEDFIKRYGKSYL